MFFIAWACLLSLASGPSTPAALVASHAVPVNTDATPEARELLNNIDQISGHFTLTGQHNFPNHVSRWSDRIYDLTGKLPAIFGQDFGFSGGDDKDSVEGRAPMIEEAKRQYRNGAVGSRVPIANLGDEIGKHRLTYNFYARIRDTSGPPLTSFRRR